MSSPATDPSDVAMYRAEITVADGVGTRLKLWILDEHLRAHPVEPEGNRLLYYHDADDAVTGLRRMIRSLEKDRAETITANP